MKKSLCIYKAEAFQAVHVEVTYNRYGVRLSYTRGERANAYMHGYEYDGLYAYKYIGMRAVPTPTERPNEGNLWLFNELLLTQNTLA